MSDRAAEQPRCQPLLDQPISLCYNESDNVTAQPTLPQVAGNRVFVCVPSRGVMGRRENSRTCGRVSNYNESDNYAIGVSIMIPKDFSEYVAGKDFDEILHEGRRESADRLLSESLTPLALLLSRELLNVLLIPPEILIRSVDLAPPALVEQ